jgi:hypothetical protein
MYLKAWWSMSWQQTRARMANRARFLGADDPEVLELRRQLREERLAEHIKRVVDEAPPLTVEQRSRLAAIFRSGADA